MQDIGLWVTPVLLVPGVGLLIQSTSVRYGQIHAELRELMKDARDGAVSRPPAEMLFEHLHNRTHLLLRALFGLYLSVGLLAFASLFGSLTILWPEASRSLVILLTFSGIFGVAFAAVQLIRESRIFLGTLKVCGEQLAKS